MVAPYNYMLNIAPPDPMGAFTQAYGQGLQLQQMRAQQQAAQLQAQQVQQKMQEQAQLRQALTELSTATTPADRVAVFRKYPAIAAPLQENFAKYDGAVKGALSETAMSGYALLQSGNAEQAAKTFQTTAEALRNSGQADLADQIDTLAKGVTQSPEMAKQMVSDWLAVNAPDQFLSYGKVLEQRGKGEKAVTEAAAAAEQRPFEMRAKMAAATTAEAKASVAAPLAAFELEKAGWDIKKLQNDIQISRQNAQIAAINAQIARAGNDLKRQELQLKVAELNDKVGTRIQERAAEGRAAQAQANTLLETADKALRASVVTDPKTGKIAGFTSTVRRATGPIESRLPTLSEDVADFEALIETLGSQVTMSRIGEMKGVLSDKDMEVLRSSMASLSLKQSPAALVSNLQNIQRLTNKAKQVTADRYGLPMSEAPAPSPTVSAGPGATPTRRRYNPVTGRIE